MCECYDKIKSTFEERAKNESIEDIAIITTYTQLKFLKIEEVDQMLEASKSVRKIVGKDPVKLYKCLK